MVDKIAIISDIHGNYDALQVVLRKIDKLGITKLFCLGDIVGYGAQPNRCYRELIKRNCVLIRGNHEDMLLGRIRDYNCSNIGKLSHTWTRENVSLSIQKELEWLPFYIQYKGISMYHSVMQDDGIYPYLNDTTAIIDAFSNKAGVVFYGHTHRPRVTYKLNNTTIDEYISETKEFFVEYGSSCYINVGSVGQQRDTKTDASFATCTFEKNGFVIKIFRMSYKAFSAYRKIVRYGSGQEVATYLIRENWRRRSYELLNNRCIGVRGNISRKSNDI